MLLTENKSLSLPSKNFSLEERNKQQLKIKVACTLSLCRLEQYTREMISLPGNNGSFKKGFLEESDCVDSGEDEDEIGKM